MRMSELVTRPDGKKYRLVPADYPNWYGISGIKFIYYNNVADPDIAYRGRLLNSHVVEDTMWEEYIRDDDGNVVEARERDMTGFEKFMLEKAEYVKALFLLAFGIGPLSTKSS